MADVAKLRGPALPPAARLRREVEASKNTRELVEYLRKFGERRTAEAPRLSPAFASLVADVLDGTLRATYKRSTVGKPMQRQLEREKEAAVIILTGKDPSLQSEDASERKEARA